VVSSSSVIDLSGQVAIVAGGNRGIGLNLARGTARAGGSVAVRGRRLDRNDEAVRELEALGANAAGFVGDVSSERGVAQAMAATHETFGRLDTLAAKVGVSAQTPFVDMRLPIGDRDGHKPRGRVPVASRRDPGLGGTS
jgi:NAD(P)-dependent dehydrogenase (short-subunit alcohol dehydrogenase family)